MKISDETRKSNVAIDIVKLILAYLVVAIHTEPFGFSFWLDKGFGIITRMCVPFFFVASSYFFFLKKGSPTRYIKRLFLLYAIWSLIYLPFDIPLLKTMSAGQIIVKYLWAGSGHALWYLCASIIGFIIVYALSKVLTPKKLLALSIVFLLIGCMKSTYLPFANKILPFEVTDFLGSRNGLFYAFCYYALGLFIADKNVVYDKPQKKNVIGFFVSFLCLCIESAIAVLVLETEATILWISVLPLTYNFFIIVKDLKIPLKSSTSYFIRKCSTAIYVSHCLVICIFPEVLYWKAFLLVSSLATLFSILIVFLSEKRYFGWLKYLI